MSRLDQTLESALADFALSLVDQQQATLAVPPQRRASGYWFGGGNMIEGPDGQLYLVGRYRNVGDSRTGLSAGQRGLELAILRYDDRNDQWLKQVSFSKADLTVGGREVLSIEGSSLHGAQQGIELFVSTEKDGIGYPPGYESHLKPGTGVWTILRLRAGSIEGLKSVPVETVFESRDPAVLHVKDPVSYVTGDGSFGLMFCTHPFCWSSSNTAYAVRKAGNEEFGDVCFDFFPRGYTWDIAITRGTCILDVPRIGAFADRTVSLLFYDGGESLRNLDEHSQAVKRPRGYSCEEIGGVAYFVDGDMRSIHRLSQYKPMFVSPHGTGCSRYVDVLHVTEGHHAGYYATWQQSQDDLSQPLVMNFLSRADAERILM